MSSISIGLSVCAPGVVGETAPAITGTAPTLDPITEGQTLNDVVTAGSANPPAGETFTGASPINEQNIDGGGWVAYVSSTAPTADQTVQVRQRWETVEGSSRTFTSVERTVAYAAPTVTASDALAARTLTITRDSLSGTPTPSVALTTLTLDGVDVLGDETETTPDEVWTYDVPSSVSQQAVVWEITATNAEGSDTASGSEDVAADQAVPEITGVPTISGTETVGETLTASAASVTGTPTPTRTWQWERSGTPIGGATNSTYTLVEADEGETITVVQTESNAVGSDSAESVATGVITAPDTTAPIVNLFEFEQAAAGDPILITLVMQDTGETNPLDAAIVFVPQGDPKPSIAQIKAGLNNAGTDALFYITKTFSGDVTGEAGTLVREPTPPFSGAVDGYCVVSDDAPNDSARAEFLNVTIETTAAVGWSITDNGDGTGTVASYPTPAITPAWSIADNGDGTGTILSHPTE